VGIVELLSGKMTSKGQITIPKELRDKLNVTEGDQFRFLISGDDNVKMEPVKKKLLSNAIGKVWANEPIDLEKMREMTQREASKEILSEEIGGIDE
jgi:antitoxin PrlF